MKTFFPIFENSLFEKQELAEVNVVLRMLFKNKTRLNIFRQTPTTVVNLNNFRTLFDYVPYVYYGLRVWWAGRLCFDESVKTPTHSFSHPFCHFFLFPL